MKTSANCRVLFYVHCHSNAAAAAAIFPSFSFLFQLFGTWHERVSERVRVCHLLRIGGRLMENHSIECRYLLWFRQRNHKHSNSYKTFRDQVACKFTVNNLPKTVLFQLVCLDYKFDLSFRSNGVGHNISHERDHTHISFFHFVHQRRLHHTQNWSEYVSTMRG